MRKATPLLKSQPYMLFFLITANLLLFERVLGDASAEIIKIFCGGPLEHNSSIFIPNFMYSMAKLNQLIRNSSYGLATTDADEAPDGHYGFVQCYGGLTPLDCTSCFDQARRIVTQCYPYTRGKVYLDGCYLRSDNYRFFEEYQMPEDTVACYNATRMDPSFEASATRAVIQAAADAPKNGGYARIEFAGPARGTANDPTYVQADCWKTLNESACKACLKNASAVIRGCLPWSEGRALNTGCTMTYSKKDFLNRVPANRRNRETTIVKVILASSFIVVLVIGVIVGVHRRKRQNILKKRRDILGFDERKLKKILHNRSLDFKYSTLEKATGYFDNANKLGQGGFGTVYKGLLRDGKEVAVKRLFLNNGRRAADFYNEVNMISRVEHKNLVKLLGCSCSAHESLLVYEFLPNKSLDHFIFDPINGKKLDWEKRYKIIIGTAEGLVYLHENNEIKIIHRDIKASNILLDSKFYAKIADFGLARSFQEDTSHISTAIAGTLGYMAPEYVRQGKLTEKADVYSFGVLLLEIVAGKQNNMSKTSEDTETLITKAWKHFQAGTVEQLYDPNLKLRNYHHGNVKIQILRVVNVGLLCTQENQSLRLTMSKALQMLTTDEILPAPTRPPFMNVKSMELKGRYEDSAGSSATIARVSDSSFYPR